MSKAKTYRVNRKLIKQLLKQKGLTLAEMSESIGRNNQALSRAMKNAGLSKPTIISIADFLEVSVKDIQEDVDDTDVKKIRLRDPLQWHYCPYCGARIGGGDNDTK